MSEEKKSEDVVGVIKEDAIVNIPMSTGYYKRIQGLLNAHLEGRTKEDFEKAHTAIKEQNITEGWVFHYETLLILCNEFEKTARAHNFIDEVPLSEYQKTVEEKMKEIQSKEDDENTAPEVSPA
jgi:hypothetical protein